MIEEPKNTEPEDDEDGPECEHCYGSGQCDECGGSGWITCRSCGHESPCEDCIDDDSDEGSGECRYCGGTGKVKQE